jgi:trans-aconitate methyltransferase
MQAQRSTATLFNRYSSSFLTARAAIQLRHGEHLGGERCRILSFGCSTGAEVLTARAYFPSATILACDINEEALDRAVKSVEEDNVHIFYSDPSSISSLGPYDIILANAVLCSYPASAKLESLANEFPFPHFVELAEMLLASLKPDGIFILNNSNYFFRDLPSANQFHPIVSPTVEGNGFVEKFGPNSRIVAKTRVFKAQRHYAHQLVDQSGRYTDEDFRHSLFTRRSADVTPACSIQSGPPLSSPELVMGGDVNEFAERGWIGAGLYKHTLTCVGKDPTAIFEWRRASISGAIESCGLFTTQADWDPARRILLQRTKWRSAGAMSSKWRVLRSAFSRIAK